MLASTARSPPPPRSEGPAIRVTLPTLYTLTRAGSVPGLPRVVHHETVAGLVTRRIPPSQEKALRPRQRCPGQRSVGGWRQHPLAGRRPRNARGTGPRAVPEGGLAAATDASGDETATLVRDRITDLRSAIIAWQSLDGPVAEARLFALAQFMVDVYAGESCWSSRPSGSGLRRARAARRWWPGYRRGRAWPIPARCAAAAIPLRTWPDSGTWPTGPWWIPADKQHNGLHRTP